jgi:hypothetical protein
MLNKLEAGGESKESLLTKYYKTRSLTDLLTCLTINELVEGSDYSEVLNETSVLVNSLVNPKPEEDTIKQ